MRNSLLGIFVVLALLALMSPSAARADDTSAANTSAAVGNSEPVMVNHALVDALAKMEDQPNSFEGRLDNLAYRVAELEKDGPWHGSLTYRTQFASGGQMDGFDHGARLDLRFRDELMRNLLINIELDLNSDGELFGRPWDSENCSRVKQAYFKYSN